MHIVLFEIISAVLFFIIIVLVCYLLYLKAVVKRGTPHSVEVLIKSAVNSIPGQNVGGHVGSKKYLMYSYSTEGADKTGYSRVSYADAEALVGKTSDVYIWNRKGHQIEYLRPDVKRIMKKVMYYYLRLIMVWLCCLIVFLIAVLRLHSF